jgi:hypothetical protein
MFIEDINSHQFVNLANATQIKGARAGAFDVEFIDGNSTRPNCLDADLYRAIAPVVPANPGVYVTIGLGNAMVLLELEGGHLRWSEADV